MKTFVLKSMGCKANQYEGAVISQSLIDNGFVSTDDTAMADYFILNSCTVTQKTDNKAFYILRNVKHTNPNIKTVLTGCIAQVEKENLLNNEFIDFVIGNDEKLNIAQFLNSETKFAVGNIMVQEHFNDTLLFDTTKTRACVKIQDGCDNRCSYCVIPFARGKSRSAYKDFILNQINELYSHSFKEIILTGIHIGQWGKDIGETFFDLLKFLEENSPVERIRFGSLNPLEIDDEILDFLSSSKKFCPHFHLSLQSACNDTLRRMNRFYTVEHYLEQIEHINSKFNLPFIGSDIIAGFAGETDEDFAITVENLRKSALSQIHTFPYSIRKGTQAEKMSGHVSEEIKEYRANVIKQISNIKFKTFLRKNINTIHSVLIEKHMDKHTGVLKGVSENYLKVIIKNNADSSLLNTVQNVKITELSKEKDMLYGEIVK
ncbi:tRNA (N(6)-L-threonylcarbamoyladenosine(37)-C(2))-methylthiotransferase MtaB [bacterium]|nr:tRNA (N(6)-L-threonylcarbamoyladenosine(37)-C(2))-methylthiotransferase MtaB [bacterium]